MSPPRFPCSSSVPRIEGLSVVKVGGCGKSRPYVPWP